MIFIVLAVAVLFFAKSNTTSHQNILKAYYDESTLQDMITHKIEPAVAVTSGSKIKNQN